MADRNDDVEQSTLNRIIPHNLTAKASYNVSGNPPSTRPESGVANCYPGLEYDHRNLDRRFFPGLLVDYVSAGPHIGMRVSAVVTRDPGLANPPGNDRALADGLTDALSAMPNPNAGSWFVISVQQSDKRIDLSNDSGDPLDGPICWRLIRSLRPGPVTLRLATRPAENSDGDEPVERQTYELRGWRRRYTDPQTGVIDPAYRPGELTQSLCSPWTHDFRDCSCTYWASNHPDIVAPAIPIGEFTQPGGRPADPQYDIEIEWLRNPDVAQMHAQALPSQQANRPFEASYYQINHQWQELAVVLEGRETDGPYIPRSKLRDEAVPFSSDEELRARIVELAGLEHLVALLYLYALFSVITPEDAAAVAADGEWPTLIEDVTFVRSLLTEVAIGEMQHLRAVNLLLWNLDKAAGGPSRPAVVPPARVLPQPGGKEPVPAELRPLTLDTVGLFIEIERSSAFIDGQYARVTATLREPRYPTKLFELASTIAEEGEEHFLNFTDIRRTLEIYPTDNPVYLRPVREGKPKADSEVNAALELYRQILDLLQVGYQREEVVHQHSLAQARILMFELQKKAEALASRRIGIPFLSLKL